MFEFLEGRHGRYHLNLDEVRAGGQATVYRATSPDSRRVAVKVARDRSCNAALSRERDALEALGDAAPWVVDLLDSGETPSGLVFLVSPWHEHTLRTWVERRDPPVPERLEALEQVCAAVHELHHSGPSLETVRVHRDLKPDNILVSEAGGVCTVRLADFGGMKEGRLLERSTQTGLYTPAYAPVEQLLPLERAPDPSLDVHGLGATVYAVLADALPRSVARREAALTPSAERLLVLHGRRERLDAAEQAELARLRSLPVEDLLDFDGQSALTRPDVAVLQNRLRERLEGDVAAPLEAARALAAVLAPALRRALEPDPRTRDQTIRPLLAACRQGRAVLQEAGLDLAGPRAAEAGSGTPPTPAGAETRGSTDTRADRAHPKAGRWWLAPALAVGAAIGVLVVVVRGAEERANAAQDATPSQLTAAAVAPPVAGSVQAVGRPPRASSTPSPHGSVDSGAAPTVRAGAGAAPLAEAPGRPDPSDAPRGGAGASNSSVQTDPVGAEAGLPVDAAPTAVSSPAPTVQDADPALAPEAPARLLVRLARDTAPRIEHDGRVHLNTTTLELWAGRSRLRVTDTLDPSFEGCAGAVAVSPEDAQTWLVAVQGDELLLPAGEKGSALCRSDGRFKLSRR